jgi:ribonuclease HI
MLFKGQEVWVRTDEGGHPVLDGDGRAEMKYREADQRSYRPLAQNLAPVASQPPERLPSRVRGSSPARLAQLPASTAARSASALAEMVHVWTDGACSGNPGPMGIGIVVVAGGKRKEVGEFLGRGTNNIAELVAIRRGLEVALTLAPGTDRPIRVYSDSSYAIGLLAHGWKAKANQALVAELRDFLRAYPRLQMVKVEGHAGVAENERCDVLARQAIAQNRFAAS